MSYLEIYGISMLLLLLTSLLALSKATNFFSKGWMLWIKFKVCFCQLISSTTLRLTIVITFFLFLHPILVFAIHSFMPIVVLRCFISFDKCFLSLSPHFGIQIEWEKFFMSLKRNFPFCSKFYCQTICAQERKNLIGRVLNLFPADDSNWMKFTKFNSEWRSVCFWAKLWALCKIILSLLELPQIHFPFKLILWHLQNTLNTTWWNVEIIISNSGNVWNVINCISLLNSNNSLLFAPASVWRRRSDEEWN